MNRIYNYPDDTDSRKILRLLTEIREDVKAADAVLRELINVRGADKTDEAQKKV